jgi:hypothetical protein
MSQTRLNTKPLFQTSLRTWQAEFKQSQQNQSAGTAERRTARFRVLGRGKRAAQGDQS